MTPQRNFVQAVAKAITFNLIFLVGFLASCNGDNPSSGDSGSALNAGREYMMWWNASAYDQIWKQATSQFKTTFGSLQNFQAASEQAKEEYGAQTTLKGERVFDMGSIFQYESVAKYANKSDLASFEWQLDSSNDILSLYVRDLPQEAPSAYLDYQTKTKLRLPFDDEWTVMWGGRSTWENYHADTPNQRFAYDFFVVKNGYFSGDGSQNAQHYAFGKTVVAPGSGVVIAAESSVPDNVPGEENFAQPLGNHVIIDHENGEYSVLAHFQRGSVVVQVGDRVVAGQKLGLCGNSGGSDLPHLHYHIQNTPFPLVNGVVDGEGLPTQFTNYFADGTRISRGEPVRGQRVHP
ncbi:peptidase M23 [Candidatus Moduliflexus flocculans]|uniref:Peptidase M23 n=1 Tax=Candidatus Moduliflexus flocculans TaxID=1499966 RepID=A0A0S6VQ05_9BACT|nr:peptidase M23 [Candidatus Moduliflexus flocculans]